jgi:hypothetical protein
MLALCLLAYLLRAENGSDEPIFALFTKKKSSYLRERVRASSSDFRDSSSCTLRREIWSCCRLSSLRINSARSSWFFFNREISSWRQQVKHVDCARTLPFTTMIKIHLLARSYFCNVQLALETLLRCDTVAQLLLQLQNARAAGVNRE